VASARLRSIIEEYSDFVARTLLTAGVPASDIDDEVQRTFVVAARRLGDVRNGSERAFLSRVARHTAAHWHRTRARRREIPIGEWPDVFIETSSDASPESSVQQRQMWTLLAGVLDGMHKSLSVVFVLNDLEGMRRGEIAARLRLPQGTVASRLRLARKQVKAMVASKFVSSDEAA
jgi:RNA polymerase sigma-70 factor (ECF subfamily)